MEYEFILLRYGEIFLKGKNKIFFERRLQANLKAIAGINKIKNVRGRLIVDYFSEHHLLKRVFGLVSYSPAVKVEKDLLIIQQKLVELFKHKKGTFKVETKRSDKTFPVLSPQANVLIGKYLEQHTSLRFSSNDTDYQIGVEINQEAAYIFPETIYCHGGLPTGVEGRVGVLIENSADLLTALLMMKRGCGIVTFGFKPKDIYLLQQYSAVKIEFNLVKNFEEIEEKCNKYKINTLVCGQIFDEYKKLNTSLTLLRPLVAYSKEEVKQELKSYEC